MAAVNRNMFDATVTNDHPREGSLMVLPLNLIALIISHVCLIPLPAAFALRIAGAQRLRR